MVFHRIFGLLSKEFYYQKAKGADLVVLETEVTNKGALSLYGATLVVSHSDTIPNFLLIFIVKQRNSISAETNFYKNIT